MHYTFHRKDSSEDATAVEVDEQEREQQPRQDVDGGQEDFNQFHAAAALGDGFHCGRRLPEKHLFLEDKKIPECQTAQTERRDGETWGDLPMGLPFSFLPRSP